jgi:hypothetical protein
MWHIFGYKMSYSTHNIIRLPVHLENEQTITYNDNDNAQQIIDKNVHTQLTAYFLLNQKDKNANEFTYPEIPLHYTFNKSTKRWTRRKYKATKTIVRMYSSSPIEGERYYLRLLLLESKSATSFKALRTIQNVSYDTFKEAAVAANLTDNDNECFITMEEARIYAMPTALRDLFITILVNINPADPILLFEKYWKDMGEDFQNQLITNNNNNNDDDLIKNMVLMDIEKLLDSFNKSLKDFKLPSINYQLANIFNNNSNKLIHVELNYNQDIIKQELEKYSPLLNRDQKNILKRLLIMCIQWI